LVAQGDGPGAAAAYRQSLALTEALAARDPANTEWQRDVSVSYERVGDALVAQGDGPGALAAYRQSLALTEALAARDPANTEWQRHLSASYDRIGNVVAQSDGPGALAAYRQSLAIREALAARDPANTEWQTDVALSCSRLGTLEYGQQLQTRYDYLIRGRSALLALKAEGRLMASQDLIGWFDNELSWLRSLL
jgi:hypothetical protein